MIHLFMNNHIEDIPYNSNGKTEIKMIFLSDLQFELNLFDIINPDNSTESILSKHHKEGLPQEIDTWICIRA